MSEPQFTTDAFAIVWAPLFVLCVFAIAVAFGRRVLGLLGATSGGSDGERTVISVAIGLGLLQFVPMLLGVFGILGPWSVRVALIALAAVAVIDARRFAAWLRSLAAFRLRWDIVTWVWLAALAIPLVYTFFVALAPVADPDGLAYHLGAPKQWLLDGSLTYLPTYVYTNGPMGAEMLFAVGLAFIGDAGAKLLHFAASITAVFGVYFAGRRVSGPMTGRICATLFLLGPFGVVDLAGWGYVEGFASLAVVASVNCWIIWFRCSDTSWLKTAALLSGIAVTFKLTSAIFPLALAALTIAVVAIRGRREMGLPSATTRLTLGITALAGVPVLPWLIRSWVVTGNPFFPLLARWIPSRDFPPSMSTEFENYNRYFLWGGRWGYDLALAERRLMLVAAAVVVIAIGTVVVRLRRDRLERAAILVLMATVVIQILGAGLYVRYWIPVVAVVQIPAVALLVGWLPRKVVSIGLLVVTLVLGANAARPLLRDDFGQLVRASVSDDDRGELRQRTVGLYELYAHSSSELPPDSGVLMTYVCGGFYIDGPSYCTEFLQSSLELTTWAAFTADIERLGITHVIAPTALADGGPRPDDGNGAGTVGFLARDGMYENVSRLLDERGILLERALDQGLYSIDGRNQ